MLPATLNGKPWDPSRKQVWFNEATGKWAGNDVPDFKADSNPKDHMGPFIMNPEGLGRLFVPLAGMADGPFPEHYEPVESPLVNPLHPKQTNSPVVKRYKSRYGQVRNVRQVPRYPCTTYRLTEHYHYWTKNNPMNMQLVPEPFVEIPEELADKLAIKGGDRLKVTASAKRSQDSVLRQGHGYQAHQAAQLAGKKRTRLSGRHPHSLGLIAASAMAGLKTSATPANVLSPTVIDPNAYTPEFKGFLVKHREGLRRYAMSNGNLEIKAISGHNGKSAGSGVSRDYDVCKLIDTTTCIGCKACEVACVEWNGYEFRETTFDNTYQTMPETAWNFWNLIKFNEVETDGGLQWLMRKDQCMHCEEPGCLIACPADGAIVQYTNGIVDFNQANCIGCQYCVTGCPFNIPKFNEATKKVYKCTLCSDRVGAGPGTGLHQVMSHRLPAFRQQGRHEV